ncbi:hypothetical protein [uncultured Methanolobus sp.]|uniref:hypothetical protein n=1 Tax=uncultured Methanolobus sp. TaxID=218300 RepID=UPI002AAB5429|nr:hypothetical protein [uncultured Methanolobus sp.]
MKDNHNGCTEMPPGMKDDTISWIESQMSDLESYWDDITPDERDIVLDVMAEELGDDFSSELSEKWSKLYTRTQQEEEAEEPTYPQPNHETCIEVIKELPINKKRELARRYCDSDVSVLSDVGIVRLMSDMLNGGSYARFFSIRGHIGRNFMQPVE